MSVSTRGLAAAPATVPRDYGLLQAPLTTVQPCPELEPDAGHTAAEAGEHDNALRAVSRYQATGSVYDAQPAPHDDAQLLAAARGRQRLSDVASAASASVAGTGSREPSLSRTARSISRSARSRSRNPASLSPAQARPLSLARSSRGTRHSFHQADHEGSFASRCRDLVLGGEPNPPPVEQVQQHYLEQHYQQDHFVPPARASRRRPSSSHPAHENRKSFEYHWSRSSAVYPRPADVAHVIEQLHLQDADIEDASERSHLAPTSRRVSYATLSAPGASGLSTQTVVPGEHVRDSHISVAPSPTVPGPGSGRQEANTLVEYTAPIWATHALELSINSITVLVIGHLGTTELAAASLASLTGNVTGFSVIQGFVSALDSLLPAACSSDRPTAVGLWTQRMVVILAALLIPIAVIWSYAESILLALRQAPEVSHLAAMYLRVMVCSLPAYAGFETSRRYLQAQGLFSAPTIAVGVASALNLPAQLLLVYGPAPFRIGFLGAPVAAAMSFWIMFLFALFQCWIAPRDAWGGLSHKALELPGLLVVWNLGLASTLAMAAEWWAWEVANLMSSMLGTTALAAQSVLLTTCSLTYQLPLSIGVAAAVRIGNVLGANQPAWASLASRTALAASLLSGVLNSGLLITFRHQWGRIFSSDPDLIHLIAIILPYVGAFQICDGLCAVGAGILRGSGRQSQGAIINIFAYYAAGLPLAAVLLYRRGWGLQGIWLGLATGLLLASIGFLALILKTNWKAEAEKVLARMAADAAPANAAEAAIEANIEAVLEDADSVAEQDEDEGEAEDTPATL